MPEITSVETIRAKLREFDERMDGAISAAKTLAHIKTDAEKKFTYSQGVFAKIEQLLGQADGIRLQLVNIQSDWQTLRQKVDNALAESQGIRDFLLSELHLAIQSLEKQLVEAEKSLEATCKKLLLEQAELLKQLDHNTRENAEIAVRAKDIVLEKAELIDTIKNQLQIEIQVKLIEAKKELESDLHKQMDYFREELKLSLLKHQQDIDNNLTQFLNKQNALIQNISQQIDSFNRVTQVLSADFSEIKSKLNSQKERLATVESLAYNVINRLNENRIKIDSQQETLKQFETQLETILEKLKKSFFVGGKFK